MQVLDSIPLAGFLFILILLIERILFLRSKGIEVGVGSNPEKMKNNKLLLYPVFGLILLLWLFEITKPAFHFSFSILPEILTTQLSESVLLKITGVVLILLSLILWTITLIHFKTSLRFGLNENNQGKLITTGIFSLSRNPFFLSLDLYFIGIALIFPTMFFVGFALLVLVGIHFFILREEKFMLKVYKQEYEKYIKKVKRYFNF